MILTPTIKGTIDAYMIADNDRIKAPTAKSLHSKRTVSFSKAASVHLVSSLKHEHLWYRQRDFVEIRKCLKLEIECYQFAKHTGQVVDFEMRGLENVLSPQTVFEAKARRAACRHAVLAEQARQKREGTDGYPTSIRIASEMVTKSSRDSGSYLAHCDAIVAADIRLSQVMEEQLIHVEKMMGTASKQMSASNLRQVRPHYMSVGSSFS